MLGSEIEFTIKHLARSGAGVGFYTFDTPRAVFVERTVPGDKVRVRITAQQKVYFEAELLEILTPSSSRVDPPCVHFGTCGACDWLHVSYEEQLRQKERLLHHAFAKRKIALPRVSVVAATEQYNYRCKLRFPGNGFSARKSNTIIPVKECHLMHAAFQEMLALPHWKDECWGLDEETQTITQDVAYYVIGEYKLAYVPSGFVQANFSMNRELIAAVVEAAGSGTILELYAGNGNFTLSLSDKGDVLAVEGDAKSYELLQKNTAHVSRITTKNEDVRHFLESHERQYDCVVLDPPRVGVGDTIELLSKLTTRVVYVSCDADALARDVQRLLTHGFAISQITLLDLFPQTRHFEIVLCLTKT